MRIIKTQTMKKIDKFCIENFKIPGIVLMENAALKVLKNLDLRNNDVFTIICGTGNNGGDGLALARHLFLAKKKVDVFLIGKEDKLSKDCKINYDILVNMGININKIDNIKDVSKIKKSLDDCSIILDAIFGTGLSREVKDVYKDVISLINESHKYVVAIDVPSGVNGDNGQALGVAVKANKTITFQFYKRGFLEYGSHDYTGDIIVEDIGIPEDVANKFNVKESMLKKEEMRKYIPIRNEYAHKGDFGKVAIIAGSKGFTGAAYITTKAAVKSGAGLVTLCCREEIQKIMSNKFIEAMTVSYKENERLNKTLKESDVIAIGPGMGNNEITLELIKGILSTTKCPLVIDADGINVLKDKLSLLKNKKEAVILTPHLGEMSRITGIPVDKIEKNRLEIAKEFSKKYNVIVLLKGYNTVITDGDKVFVNSTGNSAMASGGMGDCLTGIIASFIGQGLSPINAACLGAYVHGYCGEKLSKEMFCVNANEVLKKLPYAIKEIQNFK